MDIHHLPNGKFAPGNSASPGRPTRTAEAAMLDTIASHFNGNNGENRDKLMAAWQKLINRGNAKAIELALAYLAGKPRQDIDIGGTGGLDITVRYVETGELVQQVAALPPAVVDIIEAEVVETIAGDDDDSE